MRVVLDRKTLFALASETRIKILKKLGERRMTLTELSRELGISKTAVKEHLDKLVQAGLVKKVDEGRKWVYYELTEKGRAILHPEARVALLISSAVLSALGVLEIYRFVTAKLAVRPQPQVPSSPLTPVPVPTPATPVTPANVAGVYLVAGLILISLGVLTFLLAVLRISGTKDN